MPCSCATGKLDRKVGGPSVEFKEPRRSVYLKWLRNTKESLLDVFDIPDGFTSSARRNVTTTSTQALFMIKLAADDPARPDVCRPAAPGQQDTDDAKIARALSFGVCPLPVEQRNPLSREPSSRTSRSALSAEGTRPLPTRPADPVP